MIYQNEQDAAGGLLTRDARELVPSPLLAGIWMLDMVEGEESAVEYAAGLASVKAHGVRQPVKVLEGTNVIFDGRHRVSWAKAAGEAGEESRYLVPVKEVTEEEGRRIIHDEIFARRSMNAGQRAWSYLCLNPEVASGKPGVRGNSGPEGLNSTLGECAVICGVGDKTMRRAAELWRVLAAPKFTKGKKGEEARMAVELRVWQGDGLESILVDLRERVGPGKGAAEEAEPGAGEDVVALETVALYQGLLFDLDREVSTLQSWMHLDALALQTTATGLGAHAGSLAVAAMGRADLTASQKEHLLLGLRGAVAECEKAARKAGLKV